MLILQSASLIDMAECAVTCMNIITWYTMSIVPGVGITSEILLTATLADKDNPSSNALLSDNSSNSQETFVEGRQVRSRMACRGIYSACTCSVSKSHNEYTDVALLKPGGTTSLSHWDYM